MNKTLLLSTFLSLILLSYLTIGPLYIYATTWKTYQTCLDQDPPSKGKTVEDFVSCHNRAIDAGRKLEKRLGITVD